jgi:hypothetical protein
MSYRHKLLCVSQRLVRCAGPGDEDNEQLKPKPGASCRHET